MTSGLVTEAQASYSAGDYRACRQLALQGLSETPDDAQLVWLAGQSSLELDLDDATAYLSHLVQLIPQDGAAWQTLGRALSNTGEMAAAADAFAEAVRLRPDDAAALTDLGHAVYALHRTDEAIAVLERATTQDPQNLLAFRSLVEIHKHAGNLQAALQAAQRIADLQPDDILAALDTAELNLALGMLDAAIAAYARLRAIDVVPGHEGVAYHGMIQAEIQRERWRRALDLSIDATRVDRDELTTQLLAFIAAKLFGDGDRPTPSRAELDAALAAEHAEHRRFHAEALTHQ
ncbi:MAG TPA: tetratricopeptide repeat protein [Chloroflexota bacterium]|jgi:tetratricopeptide (TPR) repeat protein|nr:tetratricopeptide repeat protein [Chloroflexota bacterium]